MSSEDSRRQEIMFCRSGEMPFALWFDRVLSLDRQIKAATETVLSIEPDRKTVEEWAVSAYRAAWGWNGTRHVDR